MKLSQQVAEAAAVARTSTSAEQDKNAEIAQHIKYAKERITASISDMSKATLLSGKAELLFWHSYRKQHTSDSWCDSSMIHTVGEAWRTPNHFRHRETREALCQWLADEGFKNVSVTPVSDSMYRNVGKQAIIHIEWDEQTQAG